MGLKLKIFLAVTILLIGGIFYLYQQTENRYIIATIMRERQLAKSLLQFRKTKTCATSENKTNCYTDFLKKNGFVTQSADAAVYLVATFDVCGNKNMECVYQLTDVLINEIRTETFHVNSDVSRNDKLYAELFNQEIFFLDKFLRNMRKKLVDEYSTNASDGLKMNALNYIKTIDSKILILQKARIPT